MLLKIPTPSLVVLVGASGSGKSSFAARHFAPTEVISSDFCRGLVADDPNSLEATNDAFELVHYIAAKRLAGARLAVIDATNLQKESRAPLVALARKYHLFPVAIVLNTPENVCVERNNSRPDRNFGPHVVRNHCRQLRQNLRFLDKEGFRQVWILNGETEIANAEIVRVPLLTDRRSETGPFDIIGDIHGCGDELELLLEKLDYQRDENGVFRHFEGRKVVFLGDLVDRGPRVADVLELAQKMVENGAALCVRGNHDDKLLRHLQGKKVAVRHGLETSLADLETRGDEFKSSAKTFLDGLISHFVLDEGRLVVAHAGVKAEMQGRSSGAVRAFAMYGETTGETDEFGLPVRYPWANDYRGRAAVIYGHTPIPRAVWHNNTLNIDTGAVFGGELTALRWPERELVSVQAKMVYSEPIRPLFPVGESAGTIVDDVLDFSDVSGKRVLELGDNSKVTIRAENGAAALEILSRFGADPRWLIHLPPTMSPPATSKLADFLEHPAQVWEYFRENDVQNVICQEKHMGSRAIVTVCRDQRAAFERFGVEGETGIVLTRTGRRFFDDLELETQFLAHVREEISRANWWEKFDSHWFCLDAELMPWSAKAQELIARQFAPVADAGIGALEAVKIALKAAQNRNLDEESRAQIEVLARQSETQSEAVARYKTAFERYCWPVSSVEDLKLAPFHLLASQNRVWSDKNHVWHMETLGELANFSPLLQATTHKTVDLSDEKSISDAENWWLELTEKGGEGMVVKPLDFLTRGPRGLVQPALKCRGREYLRIIYGPDYLAESNLNRLRSRGLGAKRSLALREFSLGMESLNRFVAGESLRRVHECVWGVLALESEPVDPRL